MQVKGNDGTTGMGMKAQTGTNSLIYSNGNIDFRVGSTIRDLDVPSGGTTYMSLSTAGVLTLSATTNATSTTTGALVVTGGVGIGGSVFLGSKLNLAASTSTFASMRITPGTYSGTGATSGDLWWDNTGLYFRDNAGNNNNLLSMSGTVTASGGVIGRLPVFSSSTNITSSVAYTGTGASNATTYAIDASTGTDYFKVSNMTASSGTARGQITMQTNQNSATYATFDTTTSTLLISPNAGQRVANVAAFAIAPSAGTTPVMMVDGLGNLRANTKSFDIPHPTKEGYRLVYGVLEGPEHGVYHRGSGFGTDEVRIELPEYWSTLAYADYTVSLTASGPYNIYVSSKDENGFTVKRFGTIIDPEFNFEFIVIGSRKDAPLVIEQTK
jgi:hypothetical protein